MKAHNEINPQDRAVRSVLACYETANARESAVIYCERIAERFWERCTFDIAWYSFPLLVQRGSAEEAAARAADADILLFALKRGGRLDPEIQAWMESWVPRRHEREGYLVALGEPGEPFWSDISEKHLYLRQISHRAGLDYLTGVPPNVLRPIPDSLESYNQRADCVTSVLDEILRRPAAPARLL